MRNCTIRKNKLSDTMLDISLSVDIKLTSKFIIVMNFCDDWDVIELSVLRRKNIFAPTLVFDFERLETSNSNFSRQFRNLSRKKLNQHYSPYFPTTKRFYKTAINNNINTIKTVIILMYGV